MKILVTGGTGTLGSKFVDAAAGDGHTIRILSRRSRPEKETDDIQWAKGDLASGEGVSDAVRGMDVIVHAATSPGLGAEKVDVAGTRRLVKAAEVGGVDHFIYPSIVGIDDIPFSYYQHKLEAEQIVEEGNMPYTILRATQFHEFVDQIISGIMRIPFVAPLPTEFQMQSVAASEVAARLHRRLEESPAGRLPDFGGPEVLRVGEMARIWMQTKGNRKRVIRLPLPGRTAEAFREGKNTNPEHAEGAITWREWLSTRN